MKTLLFNFSVSYSGGGLKRLYEYSKWFNSNGGSNFIIHPKNDNLIGEFPNNRYFVVTQTPLQRLISDCFYLKDIIAEIGKPYLYYSYGIPVYKKVGHCNWFHISNVLPLKFNGIPISLKDRLKFSFLGYRIRHNYKNCTCISAESAFALSLVNNKVNARLIISVNGSDDEIRYWSEGKVVTEFENVAIVLGTYRYKAVDESYKVYRHLKRASPLLRLRIIGDERHIPAFIKADPEVDIVGLLPRPRVMEMLRYARYYISNTYIENSWNAASEGLLFADESYISDICPHQELLEGIKHERVVIEGLHAPVIHVKRADMSLKNLKTWTEVIEDMLSAVG
jgi:hypothetical protein